MVCAAMAITWIGVTLQFRYSSSQSIMESTGTPPAEAKPVAIDFPTFAITGTVKEVRSGLLTVEVTGFSVPGVTELREVEVSRSTDITLAAIPKVPPKPAGTPPTEPPQLPKGTPLSLNDIQPGDRVSVSSGKVDVQRKMRFTAVSVVKFQQE